MTRERSTRTIDLLDTVATFLDAFGQPILYKDLTKVLVDSGLWAEPWGAEPDQILYSALHNDVKRYGSQSRFLFLGGGAFCTALVEGAEFREEILPVPRHNVTPRDPFVRAGDMPGDADKRREKAEKVEGDKRCGNCSALTWDGPNIHLQETGGCARYSQTRRACVFKSSPPCELWSRRSETQIYNDSHMKQRVVAEAKLVMTGKKSTL